MRPAASRSWIKSSSGRPSCWERVVRVTCMLSLTMYLRGADMGRKPITDRILRQIDIRGIVIEQVFDCQSISFIFIRRVVCRVLVSTEILERFLLGWFSQISMNCSLKNSKGYSRVPNILFAQEFSSSIIKIEFVLLYCLILPCPLVISFVN